ncbi:Coatomer WD associated region domain-containing protein [Plasmodiophora brassicae]
MPLRLEIKRELSARSERVKCVDIHPAEPWVLAALFSGNVVIWNYVTETSVKTFECCDVPVRAAKFIPRKHWIICGADDMNIRVYNYNTMEKIKTFEGHSDYIRGLAIHPTMPYVLSASDDMSIKCWDWDKDWTNTQIFEGHTHYVMQVEFNPKDPNTFASASLDHTVKVWGLNSRQPHFSLEGHLRGVNCVSYFHGGDRPYLVSGADDQLIKVWDYQTKSCVATLEGHTNNVSAVVFHPVLPLIISGSEDGTIRLWHSTTFRQENTLNYGMERVWSVCCHRDSNKVAFGCDEGTIMIKIGHEEPVVSMDRNGKVVWSKNHDIVGTNVKTLGSKTTIVDGERLPLATKEMGSCEIYPQEIAHDPKARLLAVCGDGEYIIYTALLLKNKCFGPALEFVWASHSGMYAVRESTSKVKVFKNFVEHRPFRPLFPVEGIFGGALLGVRSNEFVDFYDWETCSIVRRVEVCPRLVFWSESADLVVIAGETAYFTLRYNGDLVAKYIEQGIEVGEQGIDGSFELEKETCEHVTTGEFIGDCFIYTNAANRLNYCVGGEVITLAHLDKPYYLLGYLPKDDRVYLIDKHHHIVSFSLLLSILIYETAIVRGDFEGARTALQSIPVEHHDKLARFLEGQGLRELAFEVTTDPEHKFELAVQLNNLEEARALVEADESDSKWKQLGDAALSNNDLVLAKKCFARSQDLGGLLLIATSCGDRDGLEKLADVATKSSQFNVSFLALLLLGRVDDAAELLVQTGRIPEAAFFARSYCPSSVARIVDLWKGDLGKASSALADSLTDPESHPELFPDHAACLAAEAHVSKEWGQALPASAYRDVVEQRASRNILAEAQAGQLGSLADVKPRTPSRTISAASVPRSSSSPARSPQPARSLSPLRAASPVLTAPKSRSHSPVRSPSPSSHIRDMASPPAVSVPSTASGSPKLTPAARFSPGSSAFSPGRPLPPTDLDAYPGFNGHAASPVRSPAMLSSQPAGVDDLDELFGGQGGGHLQGDVDWIGGVNGGSATGGSAALDDDQFSEFLEPGPQHPASRGADPHRPAASNDDFGDLDDF